MSDNTPTAVSTDRRHFIRQASVAVAAAAAWVVPWSEQAFANNSPNDRPTIGCIGVGGMGRGDAHGHKHFGDIVAICDVDARQARKTKQELQTAGDKADLYGDYRKVLDRNEIDVVSIVTVDHWHVKIAIEALEAGKHVFCQKPLTLTLQEGRQINAARDRHPELAFLVGTQQRSDSRQFLRAVNMIRRGMLGKIEKVTVGINGGSVGGPFPVVEVPTELDWESWLGPAPWAEYREKRCHGSFRWWYEYSGGKFTDWGAHHVDIALWALDRQRPKDAPVRIDGTDANHPVPFKDGYPTIDDSFNTSHDFDIGCHFDDGLEMRVDSRSDNGILFEGEKGRLFVNRGRITGKPIDEDWDAGKYGACELSELYKGKPYEGHKHNFYRCIREGGETVSDVRSHVATMDVCHLVAIAARLGREIAWNHQTQSIVGDKQANAMLARTPRKGYEFPTA